MDLQTLNTLYGSYIWAAARRYNTGIWDSEDVFLQVLMQLHTAIKTGKIPSGKKSEGQVKKVKSFIITKCIDILRTEIRRSMAQLDNRNEDYVEIEPPSTRSEKDYDLEEREFRTLVKSKLSQVASEFILELAYPGPTTVEIAMDHQSKKKSDKSLRMYTRNLRVTSEHVVESIRRGTGRKLSRQAIAKIRGEAQAALKSYFKESGVETTDDVIDQILGGML
ncbi:hypothetical protein KAR91_32495 [Candidatus Pacearchaeota archaeon]|nr:hypothetical protein [Candidatus Pacearchaeota archaeon]